MDPLMSSSSGIGIHRTALGSPLSTNSNPSVSPSAAHLDAISSVIFDIDEHSNTGMSGESHHHMGQLHHHHHHPTGMLEADDVNALANNLKKEVIFDTDQTSVGQLTGQNLDSDDYLMLMGTLQQEQQQLEMEAAAAAAEDSDDYDSDEESDEDDDDETDDDSDEETDDDELDRIDLDSKEQLNGLINQQGFSLGSNGSRGGPLLSPTGLMAVRNQLQK